MPARTLTGLAEHEETVRKSRFVARAAPIEDADEAMAWVGDLSEPRASHNCWAYRLGERYRFSDAGEPAGTAGRPIYGAIEAAGVDRAVVVVTRYFGGIKLGAGGLARAYAGAARRCLEAAETRELQATSPVRVAASFDAIGVVHGLLEPHDAVKQREEYTSEGVVLALTMPSEAVAGFRDAVTELTRGEAQVDVEPSSGD